jgi:hypothetical protein
MFVKDFVKKDVPQTSSNHICSLLSANTILFLLSFFPFSFLFFFFFFLKKKKHKKNEVRPWVISNWDTHYSCGIYMATHRVSET